MIKAYCKDPITLLFSGGIGDWGKRKEDKSIDIRAFLEYNIKRVTGFKGEEVTAKMSALIEYREDVDSRTRVKIGDYEWAIMAIEEPRDFSRRYLKLWLNPAVTNL